MAGRYGTDQLSIALLVLYLVIILVAQLTGFYPLAVAAVVLMVLCFLRMFSRNVNRRYAENQWFLKLWRPVGMWFQRLRMRLKGRKTHRYYHCPGCRNVLKVPKGKGKICIICPVCKMEFIKKT
jgi:hypothetical protein